MKTSTPSTSSAAPQAAPHLRGEDEFARRGFAQLALDVVEQIFPERDRAALPPVVQRRLDSVVSELSEPVQRGRAVRRASKREYDRWIEDMFRSVVDGASREELIADFVSTLAHFIETERSEALFALVIERDVLDTAEMHRGRTEPVGYRIVERCGNVHPDHWQGVQRTMRGAGQSTFWRNVFAEADGLELIPSRYWIDYQGDLDGLVRATTGKQYRASLGFWFSAINLPTAESAYPNRVLLVAYENLGTGDVPKPGGGATLEQHVLFFLSIAYKATDHTMQSLHKIVAVERGEILASLAPEIRAHEQAAPLRAVYNSTVLMANDLSGMVSDASRRFGGASTELTSLATLGSHLLQVSDAARQLLRSNEAFLNLTRAHSLERFRLQVAIDECLELTYARFTQVATVEQRGISDVELTSDRAMLVVAVINVLTNAAKALARRGSARMHEKASGRVLIQAELYRPSDPGAARRAPGAWLRLTVANNGPPIANDFRGLVFVRGRTTDSEGFGQGMYLARRICQHLGGNIELHDKPSEIEPDLNVAFVLKFPLAMPSFRIESRDHE